MNNNNLFLEIKNCSINVPQWGFSKPMSAKFEKMSLIKLTMLKIPAGGARPVSYLQIFTKHKLGLLRINPAGV